MIQSEVIAANERWRVRWGPNVGYALTYVLGSMTVYLKTPAEKEVFLKSLEQMRNYMVQHHEEEGWLGSEYLWIRMSLEDVIFLIDALSKDVMQ